ncbi:unnamed protein product [Prorocentrum cordatum]|uniref:Uncharacterized protein n=1 Tax=Prorocentrum cordatum TaxID=2364126 RepID=A0ABN9PLM6_9DINO|nr:unnamed protein product [Polarella glacialis]
MSAAEARGGVVVAFQGERGAYSEAAALQLFTGALGEGAQCLQYRGLPSFPEVFAAVHKGSAMYGVVPVENTLGGSIHANYDLLLKYNDLHVVAELDFHVRHCLIGTPRVMSHWQALAQCDSYLQAWGVQKKVAYDTAGSVKMIKEEGLRHAAGIASALAAEVYGMEIIARNIQDVEFNHTRFLMISREPCAIRQVSVLQSVKTTVVFWLPHTPGALFKAVAAFAMRDIEVVRTESRPVQPKLFKEFEEHIRDKEMQNALENLREITPYVRVIGPYPTGGTITTDVVLRTKAVMPDPASLRAKAKTAGMRIGVLGLGRFGRFLAKRLSKNNEVFVTSVEAEASAEADELSCRWLPWDTAVREMLLSHAVEVLVIATSIGSFAEVVGGLPLDAIRKAKPLVVDVLSVKSYPKRVMLGCLAKEGCDLLCTHPMFGPNSGSGAWHGLPFVFEIISAQHDYGRVKKFLSIFEGEGCRMVAIPCEEHDKQTAPSQFITHLTGRVLSATGCKPSLIDTVGFQNLCTIAEHVGQDGVDLFRGLFKYNANSIQQLSMFKQAISEVERQLQRRVDLEASGKMGAAPPLGLSSTIERISESKTAAIQALSQKLKEEGHKINDALCVGEPGYAPPPEVLAALRTAPREGHTKYSVVQGDLELRKAICEDLRCRKGVDYTPEQIVVSCGGKQSIYQAMHAVLGDGDEVLVPTPCWVSYHDIARLCGATPVPVVTRGEDGYVLQPGALAEALHASGSLCRMVVLCNPCNPTGAAIPPEQLEALAEVLERPEFSHVWVLADEIYERIVYDTEHVCFAALRGMRRRTLLINGFSKGYAMTGLRLGYLAAAHEGVAVAANKLQGQITSCASVVVQRAALAALRAGPAVDEWATKRLEELRQKRDFVMGRLSAMEGVSCVTPQGAFYALPDVTRLLARRGSSVDTSEDFSCLLLRDYKVALVPGSAFHAEGTVRISYACKMEDLEAAMDAFAKCVNELKAA